MALPCEGLNESSYSIIVNNSSTGDVCNVPATDVTINNTIVTLNLNSIIDDMEIIQDIYISVCNDVGCTTSDAIDTGIVWYYSPPPMNKHAYEHTPKSPLSPSPFSLIGNVANNTSSCPMATSSLTVVPSTISVTMSPSPPVSVTPTNDVYSTDVSSADTTYTGNAVLISSLAISVIVNAILIAIVIILIILLVRTKGYRQMETVSIILH